MSYSEFQLYSSIGLYLVGLFMFLYGWFGDNQKFMIAGAFFVLDAQV